MMVHLARVPGEEIALLDRRIPASHHRDNLLLEECGIADRAVRHSPPRELELAGNSELDRRSASRYDRRGRAENLSGLGLGVKIAVWHLRHRRNTGGFEELSAELLGVRGKFLGQLVAENLREADHVVQVLGVEQLSARKSALEHGRTQHCAAGIERGGHSCRPRTDDDNIVVAYCRHRTHLERSTTNSEKHLTRCEI